MIAAAFFITRMPENGGGECLLRVTWWRSCAWDEMGGEGGETPTLMLLVANLANTKLCEKTLK